jgi:hypothetical protein
MTREANHGGGSSATEEICLVSKTKRRRPHKRMRINESVRTPNEVPDVRVRREDSLLPSPHERDRDLLTPSPATLELLRDPIGFFSSCESEDERGTRNGRKQKLHGDRQKSGRKPSADWDIAAACVRLHQFRLPIRKPESVSGLADKALLCNDGFEGAEALPTGRALGSRRGRRARCLPGLGLLPLEVQPLPLKGTTFRHKAKQRSRHSKDGTIGSRVIDATGGTQRLSLSVAEEGGGIDNPSHSGVLTIFRFDTESIPQQQRLGSQHTIRWGDSSTVAIQDEGRSTRSSLQPADSITQRAPGSPGLLVSEPACSTNSTSASGADADDESSEGGMTLRSPSLRPRRRYLNSSDIDGDDMADESDIKSGYEEDGGSEVDDEHDFDETEIEDSELDFNDDDQREESDLSSNPEHDCVHSQHSPRSYGKIFLNAGVPTSSPVTRTSLYKTLRSTSLLEREVLVSNTLSLRSKSEEAPRRTALTLRAPLGIETHSGDCATVYSLGL